jgi:hypothetical protein
VTGDATLATQQTQRRTAVTTHEDRLKGTDVGRTHLNSKRISDTPESSARGFGAFEGDFRGHHQTNAAQRRGPYERYRVVYCYGYDLGSDPRYRNVDWPTVEQAARPGWEERNPGTWEQFKETIQYAWDKARGQC